MSLPNRNRTESNVDTRAASHGAASHGSSLHGASSHGAASHGAASHGAASSRASSDRAGRLLQWISDRRWLVLGAAAALLLVRSGAQRAGTLEMRRHRQAIAKMSRGERQRLRENYEVFRSLSAQEKDRLRAIHRAVSTDPGLNETLRDFHSWMDSLPFEQRERILRETSVEARFELIGTFKQAALLPRFLDSLPARLPLASLELDAREFEAMMQAAAEWTGVSGKPENPSPMALVEHHTKVMSSVLDRFVPGWQEPRNAARIRPRPEIPDSLRESVLDALSRPGLSRMIRSRPIAQQNMLAVLMLGRGLLDEVHRVGQKLQPTEDELLEVYLKLPEGRRKWLDAMPKQLYERMLIQHGVTGKLPPEAGKQLARLSRIFERLMLRGHRPDRNEVPGNRNRRPEIRNGPPGRRPPPPPRGNGFPRPRRPD